VSGKSRRSKPSWGSGWLALAAILVLPAIAPASQEKPRRWVSLAPSMTEILFDVGAGREVAGVCAPSDYPPEARALPAVASFEKVDLERLLALRPSACFTVEGMQSPRGSTPSAGWASPS